MNDIKIKTNCRFCEEKSCEILHQNLLQKYFSSFNFLLAKPITEILQKSKVPHVVLFKDNQIFFDDSQTYIKFHYNNDSIFDFFKGNNATKSFQTSLFPFYDLKAIKKRDLLLKKTEHSSIFSKSGSSSKKNSKEVSFCDSDNSENNPFGYIKKTRVQLAEDRMNKSGSFLKDLEKHLEELSFETLEFNIYDPQYSSEESILSDSLKFIKESPIEKQQLVLPKEEISNKILFNFEENELPAKKSSIIDEYKKKTNDLDRNFHSIANKSVPLFLIKKNLVTKPKDRENKAQQIKAGLRQYNSMNTHPLYSTSYSNHNSKRLLPENKSKNQEEIDLESMKTKKKGLKEKILEMNKIYTNKPVFSTKLFSLKEK